MFHTLCSLSIGLCLSVSYSGDLRKNFKLDLSWLHIMSKKQDWLIYNSSESCFDGSSPNSSVRAAFGYC